MSLEVSGVRKFQAEGTKEHRPRGKGAGVIFKSNVMEQTGSERFDHTGDWLLPSVVQEVIARKVPIQRSYRT